MKRSSSKELWTQRLVAWQRSGLSQSEFARREGLRAKDISRWKQRLGFDGPRVVRRRTAPSEVRASDLIELESRPADAEAPQAPSRSSAFSLELGNGRTLQIGSGFDAAALRTLLEVLEEQR